MSEKKQPADLGLLEEDDEFEEFPAEGSRADGDSGLWAWCGAAAAEGRGWSRGLPALRGLDAGSGPFPRRGFGVPACLPAWRPSIFAGVGCRACSVGSRRSGARVPSSRLASPRLGLASCPGLGTQSLSPPPASSASRLNLTVPPSLTAERATALGWHLVSVLGL